VAGWLFLEEKSQSRPIPQLPKVRFLRTSRTKVTGTDQRIDNIDHIKDLVVNDINTTRCFVDVNKRRSFSASTAIKLQASKSTALPPFENGIAPNVNKRIISTRYFHTHPILAISNVFTSRTVK
jgi:hypothetical protein